MNRLLTTLSTDSNVVYYTITIHRSLTCGCTTEIDARQTHKLRMNPPKWSVVMCVCVGIHKTTPQISNHVKETCIVFFSFFFLVSCLQCILRKSDHLQKMNVFFAEYTHAHMYTRSMYAEMNIACFLRIVWIQLVCQIYCYYIFFGYLPF